MTVIVYNDKTLLVYDASEITLAEIDRFVSTGYQIEILHNFIWW